MRTALVLLILLVISPAQAQMRSGPQAFPTRPVRLVTPSAPGSTADLLGRMVGQKLSEAWGQQVVVDARPGAAGIVASEIVANAPADGYTLIMVAGNHAINPSLYSKLPYDTARDFAPVTQIGAAPLLVASHPAVPVSSMKDLIAYARVNPGRLNYASAGKGTPGHLVMELLSSMAKLQLVHVSYSGGGPVLNAVVSGETHTLASGVLILMPLVKAGKLRALAVTGTKRSPIAPDVPTIAESGVPGFAVSGWWGILAPGATPRPTVERIQKDIAAALGTPDVQARLAKNGIEPVGSTPQQFNAFVRDEMARWSTVVRDAGIRAN
jgi:tripartite-type tricarboxylate transporter receptor subunit TctC